MAGDRCYEHRLLGEGEVDHQMIAEFLRGIEYTGWVAADYTGAAPRDVAAEHELRAMGALFGAQESEG